MKPRWEIRFHADLRPWYEALDHGTHIRVEGVIDYLAKQGPGLGRPTVDTVTASRHRNMKELRTGSVRILFAFDPRRRAILLVGGDKRGQWEQWYKTAIPLADDRYDQHLKDLEEEG
jgi:hypothetical protein